MDIFINTIHQLFLKFILSLIGFRHRHRDGLVNYLVFIHSLLSLNFKYVVNCYKDFILKVLCSFFVSSFLFRVAYYQTYLFVSFKSICDIYIYIVSDCIRFYVILCPRWLTVSLSFMIFLSCNFVLNTLLLLFCLQFFRHSGTSIYHIYIQGSH